MPVAGSGPNELMTHSKILLGEGGSRQSIKADRPESVGDSLIMPEEAPASLSGPPPPPHLLAAYEDVLVGSAARILRQVEAASEHRRDLESAVVSSNLRLRERGQWCAFVAAMTALVGGIALSAIGKPVFGTAISIIAVGMWAGMFVWTMRKEGRVAAGGSGAGQARVLGEVRRADKEPIPLPELDGGGWR